MILTTERGQSPDREEYFINYQPKRSLTLAGIKELKETPTGAENTSEIITEKGWQAMLISGLLAY